MTLKLGERWRCTNRYCNCEIEVIAPPDIEGGANPRCSCGEEMKRFYKKPAIRSWQMGSGQEMKRSYKKPAVRTKAMQKRGSSSGPEEPKLSKSGR